MHCNAYDSNKDLKFVDLLGQLIDNNISNCNFLMCGNTCVFEDWGFTKKYKNVNSLRTKHLFFK